DQGYEVLHDLADRGDRRDAADDQEARENGDAGHEEGQQGEERSEDPREHKQGAGRADQDLDKDPGTFILVATLAHDRPAGEQDFRAADRGAIERSLDRREASYGLPIRRQVD